MLSTSFDIGEFIDKVKDRSGREIIHLADQEATEAERLLYRSRHRNNGADLRSYAMLLKDIVLFMRHGVRTHAVRQIDLQGLETMTKVC